MALPIIGKLDKDKDKDKPANGGQPQSSSGGSWLFSDETAQKINKVVDTLKAVSTPVKGVAYKTADGKAYSRVSDVPKPAKSTASSFDPNDTPTARAILARIYTIGQTDKERGEALYNQYQGFVNDRTSPIWNPYAQATNTKPLEALAALGVDVTGGMTKERLNSLRQYADYTGHTGTAGTPLAPTKSSTPAQDLAYWLWQLEQDEAVTAQAEDEWSKLQAYIGEQVKLGKADDEILSGIDWKSYATLVGMDDARKTGVPTQLNRAIGYSEDALYGALWAARNNGGSGDLMIDAVSYTLNRGNMLTTAPYVAPKPESDVTNYAQYNPYNGISADFDGYAQQWGVKEITKDVLNQHRELLNDPDGAKAWNAMLDATDVTDAARTELEALKKDIAEWQKKGYSASEIESLAREALAKDYKTLGKLEDGRVRGKPLALTGAVGFTLPSLLRTMSITGVTAPDSKTERPVASEHDASVPKTDDMTPVSEADVQRYTSSMNAGIAAIASGRQTDNPVAADWYERYGWLLGGSAYAGLTTTNGGVNTEAVPYDTREERVDQNRWRMKFESTGIGQAALAALKIDSAGEKGGWVSSDTRIEHAVKISEDMEAAKAEGLTLDDYYTRHTDVAAQFEQWQKDATAAQVDLEKRAAADQEREIEAVRAGIQRIYEAADPSDLSDTELALRQEINGIDVNAYAAYDDTYRAALGSIGMAVDAAFVLSESGDVVADRLVNSPNGNQFPAVSTMLYDDIRKSIDRDMRYAAAMRMTLDEFYDRVPGARKDIDTLAATAVEDFNAEYLTYGNSLLETLIEQYLAGPESLYDEPKRGPKGETFRETAGAPFNNNGYDGSVAGAAAKTGFYNWLNGHANSLVQYGLGLNEVQSRILFDSADEYIAAQARSLYSPEEYRAAVEASVADLADADEKQFWTDRLNGWTGDIYNVGYDISMEELQNRVVERQQYIDETAGLIRDHGTGWERFFYKRVASDTQNILLVLQGTLAAKFGLGGLLNTVMTYGLPEGAETAQALKESSPKVSNTAAALWGVAQAVITGGMEKAIGVDKIIGSPSTGFPAKLASFFDESTLRNLGGIGLAKNLTVNGLKDTLGLAGRMIGVNFVSEGLQEGAEYVEGNIFNAIAEAAYSDKPFAVAFHDIFGENFSAAEMAEAAKEGGLSGILLGMFGGDVDFVTSGRFIRNNQLHQQAQDAASAILHNDGTMTEEDILDAFDVLSRDLRENREWYDEYIKAMKEAEYTVDLINSGAVADTDAAARANLEQAKDAQMNAQGLTDEAQRAFDMASTAMTNLEDKVKAGTASDSDIEMLKQIADETAAAKEALAEANANLAAARQAVTEAQTAVTQGYLERLEAVRAKAAEQAAKDAQAKAEAQAAEDQTEAGRQAASEQADADPTSRVSQLAGEIAEAEQAVTAAEAALKRWDKANRHAVRSAVTKEARDAFAQERSVLEAAVTDAQTRLNNLTAQRDAQAATVETVTNGAPEAAQAAVTEGLENGTLSMTDARRLNDRSGLRLDLTHKGKPGVTWEVSPTARKKVKAVQNAQVKMLDALGRDFGVSVVIRETMPENGYIVGSTNTVYVALDAVENGILHTGVHEMVHFISQNNADGYSELLAYVRDRLTESGFDWDEAINARIAEYAEQGVTLTDAKAVEEIIAETVPSVFTDEAVLNDFADKHRTAFKAIRDWFRGFWEKLTEIASNLASGQGHWEAVELIGNSEALRKMYELFIEGGGEAGRKFSEMVAESDAQTEVAEGVNVSDKGVAYSDSYSFRTLPYTDYVKERDKAAESLSTKLGVSVAKAQKWIDNLTTVSAMIAMDKARLDFEPETSYEAVKANSEYGLTVDFSTLCKKRLWFTGTFDAIQSQLADARLNEDDYTRLRQMMADRGYEVACAFCYVESRRKENGRVIGQFIDAYNKALAGDGQIKIGNKNPKIFSVEEGFTPTIADFNTTDGSSNTMHDHPGVWEAYMAFMNHKGVSKPKLIENRTDYEQSILTLFKNKAKVESFNAKGGLRLQSFSDFETVNLLDMMQVVTDMARVGLKSQAYTKVPNFAKVFGATGVKINLSLVADGVDENGQLIFNDIEGMPHDEAFAIRDGSFLDGIEMDEAERERLKRRYSQNVGTILVGKDDATIRAAMADPRIDFIIPYHRSGWSQKNQEALGIAGYRDHSAWQNEKVNGKQMVRNSKGEMVKRKISNFFPSDYWDYSLTGDENAQRYLDLCEQDGRIPKFPQYAGMPGYWKMLGDFKMYDNDGAGAPQEAVTPDINMDEAQRIINEYKGGHETLPVASEVVDEFVSDYKSRHGKSYSFRTPRQQSETVQSIEKTFKTLFSDLGVQYTIGTAGYAARDGRRAYSSGMAGATHTLDPQDSVELSRQVARQLNYKLRLSSIGNVDTELVPAMFRGQNMLPTGGRITGEMRSRAIQNYVSAWLHDSANAMSISSAFTSEFEERLKAHGYYDAMAAARDAIDKYYAANALDRLKSDIDIELPSGKTSMTVKQAVLDGARKAEVTVGDYTYGLERLNDLYRKQFGARLTADEDPRTLLLANANRGQNFTDAILFDGLVDPEGHPIGDKSLRSITSKVGAEREADFNAYWIAHHGIDRLAAGKPVTNHTQREYEQIIAELDAKHPDFAGLLDEAIDWYDKFMLAWAVNTEMIMPDEYRRLREMYPHYIPTYRSDFRTGENGAVAGTRTGTSGATNGLMAAQGSDRDLYNPIMGLSENVQRLVANYRSAEFGRTLVSLVYRTDDNAGFAEIVSREEAEFDGDDAERAGRSITLDSSVQVNGTTMRVLMGRGLNGEAQYVTLQINDPLILAAVASAPRSQTNALFRGAGAIKKLITASATGLSPFFSVANMIGDFQKSFLTGSYAITPIDALAKWSVGALNYSWNHFKDSTGVGRVSETYRLYKLFGQMNSKYNFRDKTTAAEVRKKLYGKRTGGEILKDIARSPIFDGYVSLVEWLNNNSENVTRYTEFMLGANNATDDYAGALAAGRSSRELTTDFGRRGTGMAMRVISVFTPFFDATVQGLNQGITQVVGDSRGRREAILAKAGEIAALGAMAAILRQRFFDDDDKEIYDQIQDDYKQKYYIFRNPFLDEVGQFIRIKKSQDPVYMLADQMGEFIANYATGADGTPLDTFKGMILNLVESSIFDSTTIFSPILDATRNETWYDTPIESYRLEQIADVTERYDSDTSELWIGMSQALSPMIPWLSPKKAEYIVRQYFGSYGTVFGKALQQLTNGELTAASFGEIVLDRLTGRLTIDGATANQASNTFYDSKSFVEGICKVGKKADMPVSAFRYDLTEAEFDEALEEAEILRKETLKDCADRISELWDEYDAEDDEAAKRDIRLQIMRVAIEGNAAVADFRAKWCYENSAEKALWNTINLLTDDKVRTPEND